MGHKPQDYWNKQGCHKYALKYKTKSSWEQGHRNSYNYALKHNWISSLTRHMDVLKQSWTLTLVKKEAAKFKTRTEFQKQSAGAYTWAIRRGLLNKICKHMMSPYKPKGYWNKERCHQSARQYSKRIDWENEEGSAYNKALKMGWIQELTAHMTEMVMIKGVYRKWTKDRCLISARECTNQPEWLRKYPGAVNAAYHNGWTKACIKHMTAPSNGSDREIYWFLGTLDEEKIAYVGLGEIPEKRAAQHLMGQGKKAQLIQCLENGSLEFYTAGIKFPQEKAKKVEQETMDYFKEQGYRLLNLARAGALGSNVRKWNKETVLKEARKFNSIKDWTTNSASSYGKALKLKIIEQCIQHMILSRRRPGKWTKSEVKNIAMQFETRSAWAKGSGGSLKAAKRYGWFQECTQHMVNGRIKWTLEACKAEASKYRRKVDWKKGSQSSYQAARTNGWIKVCAKLY